MGCQWLFFGISSVTLGKIDNLELLHGDSYLSPPNPQGC